MVQAGYTYVDPDTGETRRVLGIDERNTTAYEREEATRSGYDKPVMGVDGKPLIDAKGNPVMQHIEGTQEASSRIAARELELKEKGLDMEDAHFQATLEDAQRAREGYYKIQGVTFDQLICNVRCSRHLIIRGQRRARQ